MPTFAPVSCSAARLRQATWAEQIQQAYLIFIGASFLMFLLPGGIKHALRPLYLVAPCCRWSRKTLPTCPMRWHVSAPLMPHARGARCSPPAGRRSWSAWCASPFDKPNTVLVLKGDSQVRLRHLGVVREKLFCIFLYIDNSQDLVQALSTH